MHPQNLDEPQASNITVAERLESAPLVPARNRKGQFGEGGLSAKPPLQSPLQRAGLLGCEQSAHWARIQTMAPVPNGGQFLVSLESRHLPLHVKRWIQIAMSLLGTYSLSAQ